MIGVCVSVEPSGICSFQFDYDKPEIGYKYSLEDATDGTGAQNRAFHALVQEFWRCGMHSYNVKSFSAFRDQIKLKLGAGFESYFYVDLVDGEPRAFKADDYNLVPEHIRKSEHRNDMMFGKLKSWGDYTKKERKETIDNLIVEMEASGVNTRKYQEIRAGME